MDDGDEGVNGYSDTNDEDDDNNYYGAKGIESDEPFNDEEGRDGKARDNIKNEDDIGIFDWNEIDAEIVEENQEYA